MSKPALQIFFASLYLFTVHAVSDIYRCPDKTGKMVYTDQPCDDGEDLTDTIESKVNVAPFDEKVELGEAGERVIYQGDTRGRKSRFLRVSIHEETDTYMIFFVEGYFNKGDASRAEFRVMPNMHWRARSFESTNDGASRGYARVSMGTSDKAFVHSDVITLQLWEYHDKKPPRVLETHTVPFKKKWLNAN